MAFLTRLEVECPLCDNEVGNAGAVILAESISANSGALLHLMLAGNLIGSKGIAELRSHANGAAEQCELSLERNLVSVTAVERLHTSALLAPFNGVDDTVSMAGGQTSDGGRHFPSPPAAAPSASADGNLGGSLARFSHEFQNTVGVLELQQQLPRSTAVIHGSLSSLAQQRAMDEVRASSPSCKGAKLKTKPTNAAETQ
jgi:hypothetical protein